MKWFIVVFICISLEHEMLVESKRSIPCSSFSRNLNDYTINYQPLLDECTAQAFKEPAAVEKLKKHNSDVYKVVSDMRQYTAYNRRLLNSNRFSRQEQTKILQNQFAAIKKANEEYKTTQQTSLTQIDQLVAQLDPTQAMQTCRDTILTANIQMTVTANELIDLPNQLCDQFKATLDTFNTALGKAYTLIGAPIPA
ncbi:uncharacterized protein LOC129574391 [Sitodiplosis mosellana]|uniref:uncharacterized protein LOC129574391 n=1 Tax=Sitodiplosis mosellana TaxID=263140 RepID=UPI002444EF3D|nr:uncharacterized protein LOC129574391 [Sitodiplosis mosellana]